MEKLLSWKINLLLSEETTPKTREQMFDKEDLQALACVNFKGGCIFD
jgi:hypothetical protein